MFQDFLLQLSKISVGLIGRIEEDRDQIINTIIFGKNFSGDVFEYKKKYFRKLRLKEEQLLIIQQSVYGADLTQRELSILLQEIENRLLKIEFLCSVYNTEAQKIDKSVQVCYPCNIEIYNKAFFGVTKKDVGENMKLEESRDYENIYKKSELLTLISIAKHECPEIQFKFGNYPNFSHRAGVLRVPNQKYYNLQNIITLFFHETTHFFRTFNGIKNMGFAFQFAGYSTLEEGIAIYNEYYYGNKICDYGNFIPYYNLCIKILLSELSENEKKEEIYQILSHKGFDREKSNQYYNRFYKYCRLGGTFLFLKELIYYNGYKNVKKLIRKDPQNYKKIMAGDIGIEELKQGLVNSENNYDYKKFFLHMVREIKNIQKIK